jgi:hypothetical protein
MSTFFKCNFVLYLANRILSKKIVETKKMPVMVGSQCTKLNNMPEHSDWSKFLAYCQRTFVGVVRVIYRQLGAIKEKGVFFAQMQLVLCQYLNQCYKSLLLKDDPQVMDDCAPFASHSPVCLFTLMHRTIMLMAAKLSFDTLSFTNIDSLSVGIQIQFTSIALSLPPNPSFMHNCQGVAQKDCNPLDPLFVIQDASEECKSNVTWFCSAFGCTKSGPYRCGKCKKAHYCSRQHQKDSWKEHAKICNVTQK